MIHVLALFLIFHIGRAVHPGSSDLKENGKENGKEEKPDTEEVRPESFASDDEMLDYIQKVHLNYMWDGAEPTSGLARERIHMDGVYPENDQNVITSGWKRLRHHGLYLAGIDRGYVTRQEGLERMGENRLLLETADRFHGATHTGGMGDTGKVKPSGRKTMAAPG